MLVTAEFTHRVLPPHGIPIDSLKTHLGDFTMQVEGEQVLVKPMFDEMAFPEPVSDEDGNEIGERPFRYRALHGVMTVVRLEVGSVEPASFDTGPFERRALVALRATLRQLRATTSIPDIDVHVAAVDHNYRNEAGKPLPWGATHSIRSIDFEAAGYLTADSWQDVESRVTQGSDTSLVFELTMEARRFRRQRNFNMALLNAAVACEAYLNDLGTGALVLQRGISRSAAKKLAQEMSKGELAGIVGRFYTLSTEAIASIQKTFALRNRILHRDRRKNPISRGDADAAIDAAGLLAKAQPKVTATPGPA